MDIGESVFSSNSEEREFWSHLISCEWCQRLLFSTELGELHYNCFEDEVFWIEVKSYLDGKHPTPEHFVESLSRATRALSEAGLPNVFEEFENMAEEEFDELLRTPVEDLIGRQGQDVFNVIIGEVKRIFHHILICQTCYRANIEAWKFLIKSYTSEELMGFKF